MSERGFAGFLVTFEKDIDGAHAELVVSAIGLIRGVLDVKYVGGLDEYGIAEARARNALESRIIKALREKT